MQIRVADHKTTNFLYYPVNTLNFENFLTLKTCLLVETKNLRKIKNRVMCVCVCMRACAQVCETSKGKLSMKQSLITQAHLDHQVIR